MSTSHYHHGDLRRALVTAALNQLEKGGAESVGLRETARAVGVSPSAPYRHFDSRARLLMAVAAEGFRRFFAVLRDARDAAAPEVKGVYECSRARPCGRGEQNSRERARGRATRGQPAGRAG